MKIRQIKAAHIQIPLNIKFSQSNNATKFSDSIILELITSNDVRGYGESCPRLYVTGEDWRSVYKDFQVVDTLIKDREFEDIAAIQAFVLKNLYPRIGPASLCAIELALLDGFGKENKIMLTDYFGLAKEPGFLYSGVIPLMELPKLELFLEHRLSRFNFSAVKLKVGSNLKNNLEKLDLIQTQLGSSVKIRVDANCSWNYEDAIEQIPAYLEKGVNSFEQIFPKGNENEMGKITKLFKQEAKIMADESSTTYESVKYLITNDLCNFFNFKISKNGGIFNTMRIYQLITENGSGCQLGAHFGETSLLTMAGLLFAGNAPDLSNFEGALGTYLLEADICQPSLKIDQNGRVGMSLKNINSYGLGFDIDRELLFKYSV